MASSCPLLSGSLSGSRARLCLSCQFRRAAHGNVTLPSVPEPTSFVPDAPSFLSLIGRGLSKHTSKIPDWHSLFTLTGKQLQVLGVEPARSRKYLLWWRDRFRRGIYGPGGDLKHVNDGQAELRIVEVSRNDQQPVKSDSVPASLMQPLKRIVVNGTQESLSEVKDAHDLRAIEGMQVKGHGIISGAFALHTKDGGGRVATIKRQEGMWEVKRGTKVDGGERRRKEIRRKRTIEANKL